MTTREMSMSPGFSARSDVGRQREHNEDRYLAVPPLFAVADGLGGHSAGEVAAEIVIGVLERVSHEVLDGRRLAEALRSANREIRAAAGEGNGRDNMGTTCTALTILDDVAYVAHVGDSRAYVLRGDTLHRLTDDQTLVGDLVREGVLTEAQAEEDDRRHVLTQALGVAGDVDVQAFEVGVERGDRFLICSDGLSGQLSDNEIASTLIREGDPGVAVDRLVDLANGAGGVDNVTVIVVDADALTRGRAAAAPPARGAIRRTRAIVATAAAVAMIVVAVAVLARPGGGPTPSPTPLSTVNPTSTPIPIGSAPPDRPGDSPAVGGASTGPSD